MGRPRQRAQARHQYNRTDRISETIREIVYPAAQLEFDPTKPDGAPRKLLDVSKLSGLGWKASTQLREGIESTYSWFLDHSADARGIGVPVG